ncbi:MAG: uracil-DNA glycosylase [Verrucomicrobiae bacterium]|nr:uracil-DNA glycosylase [Verrucomicrobiae bacterium]MCB1091007.1 uracil-DNA glycosylase [Verrucomicrobiae bacterium]
MARPPAAAPVLRAEPEPPRVEPAPQPAQPTAQPSEAPTTTSVSLQNPPGSTKAEKIAWLARQAERCEECRGLGTLRDTMVFSVGNPEATLMFVGEAPGFEEERQREPFVGPAGQLLTKIIQTMGLRRPEDIYISNIVKFRPLEGDARHQGTRNRKPSPIEMAAAVKYVLAEISVIQPKAIVALGATAAEGLLNLSGSVSAMRGRFHDLNGIPVMVTYHPSYLLRAEGDGPVRAKAEKRKVWEDMLKVMERLGLPISERQQKFFA